MTTSGDAMLKGIVLVAASAIVGFWLTGYLLDHYYHPSHQATAAAVATGVTPLVCEAAISEDTTMVGVRIRMPQ